MAEIVITKQGLRGDIPEDVYHADPVQGGSLSVTASRHLIPPSPPAKFDWARKHPKPPTSAMDLGTVVHGLVLGAGADIAVVEAGSWRGKEAKEQHAAAIASGKIPMLIEDYDRARAIADALLTHPTTGGLLAGVDPEVSMFWVDDEFGIWLRGRMDAMTLAWAMPTIIDVKTTKDASPDAFAKSAAEWGYHRQDPHYRDGLAACVKGDPDEIDFVFACVETEPPYLVAAYRVDAAAVDVGRGQNHIAREIYAACTEAGRWPGYSEEIEDLSLPYWKRRDMEKMINDWHS